MGTEGEEAVILVAMPRMLILTFPPTTAETLLVSSDYSHQDTPLLVERTMFGGKILGCGVISSIMSATEIALDPHKSQHEGRREVTLVKEQRPPRSICTPSISLSRANTTAARAIPLGLPIIHRL